MVKILIFPKVRFQYRLRTMFVLVAVAAMPCVWLAWKMEAKRKEQAAVAAIEKHGGKCEYRPLVRGLGGHWDDFCANVDKVFLNDSENADEALKYVGALKHFRMLLLRDSHVTDAGLSNVEGLNTLRDLWLDHTQITDTGLKHLGKLTNLDSLLLDGTQVTDAGLKHLKGLTRLNRLSLRQTQVTDAGLEYLRALTGLEHLWITDTQITDSGVSELHKALPHCRIMR